MKILDEENLISILMSVYKEPLEYISKAIESILNQTYRNIEFIIIIDDPNNEKAISYIKHKAEEDCRIRFFVNEKNIGLSQSLNRGLSYCSGEIIARMDADDIAFPNRLETELQYMRDGQFDIVGSGIIEFDDSGYNEEILFPEKWIDCLVTLRYGDCVPHPTWLVKKHVYEELKGYRNIFACEDYDFIIRAAIDNYRIGNVPICLLKYRNNKNGISNSNWYRQCYTARVLSRFYRKNKVIPLNRLEKKVTDAAIVRYRKYIAAENEYSLKRKRYGELSLGLEKIRIFFSLVPSYIFFERHFLTIWKRNDHRMAFKYYKKKIENYKA